MSDNPVSIAMEEIRQNVKNGTKKLSLLPMFWKYMIPEMKAKMVFFSLLAVQILLMFYSLTKGSEQDDLLLINYLLHGDWEKGFNMFAVFSIFFVVSTILVLMAVFKYILMMISVSLDNRGETICRLIFNCTKYLTLICILYFSFGCLGIDTRSILASLGVVSLAISIGSKDLVNNIVSGLTIIFEGNLQVGDIVEIAGYRGIIQEIGVRSTKLLGKGNNIKFIDNSDVRNVLNLTKLNSVITTDVVIPSSQSLDDVITMLEEELPKIKEKESRIIDGPSYYGVTKFGGNSSTICIVTECSETDYYDVDKYLNKALFDLFKEKGIQIG